MKKQPRNWLIFSGLAFQIGTVMYIMIYLGRLDTRKMGHLLQMANIAHLIHRIDIGVTHHHQTRQQKLNW